jgi:hypothetical protein
MAKKSKDAPDSTEVDTSAGLRLTDHPRAHRTIGVVKSWGGLAGFALGLVLGARAGLPTTDALLRGIGMGVVSYMIAWAGAVAVWRQLARAEVDEMRAILVDASRKADAEVARRRAEREAAKARTS